MTRRDLNAATRRAVIEETIFRPRNAVIAGLTGFLAFAFPPLAGLIAIGGVVTLIASGVLTYLGSSTKDRALEFALAHGARPNHIDELSNDEVKSILAAYINALRGNVSKEIMQQVQSIQSSMNEILPYIQDINSANREIYVVRQTALEYLPDTIDNYLNLSRRHARERVVGKGKTAHDLLIDQLSLLDLELKETIEDLHKNDTQALLAHGRFLKEKFGKNELSLPG